MIGDIHGRKDLLADLLTTFVPRKDDFVVFLGDYIDRGPDSRGVIDTLIDYRRRSRANVQFLMGNHEAGLIRSFDDPMRHTWLIGMQGLTTIRSYSDLVADQFLLAMSDAGPDLFESRMPLPYEELSRAMPGSHREFLRDLIPCFRSPDVVCVHAGVSNPYRGLAGQSQQTFIWGTDEWWHHYRGEDTIAYGHWGNAVTATGEAEPFVCNRTYGLDCSGIDEMLAVRFPDRRIFLASNAS